MLTRFAVAIWLVPISLNAQMTPPIVVTTPAGTQHEMVLVAAGECTVGAPPGWDALPVQVVYLPDLYIDKYEVTNGLYRAFLQDTGRQEPEAWAQVPHVAQPDSLDYPAIGIRWPDAVAYCQWAGLRLPTGLEWEKAARGTDGRSYPWGEGMDDARANHGGLGGGDVCCTTDSSDGHEYTARVGSYRGGASPYGAYDMAGNVSEWTTDLYQDGAVAGLRAVRGGSYHRPWEDLATFSIAGYWEDRPGSDYRELGFRCVCDPSSSAVPASTWGQVKDDGRD
jgi:formylglycine-generating enzyme required for sulfatase activity